ncbi:MAG: SpoVR family protein [Candidatus Schekmanbacteria bacterium]|nr:SpoVR family protein [Candidatus Schekmanbacteria bacterium]
MADLPAYLETIRAEIEEYAREYGLDFFSTIFELLDYKQLNAVAAYGGFPNRYPHWSFGMEYERLSKGYTYGLQKIYELVINNNPSYAYLLECNHLVDQKLVMAHVYGHVDFFKNNFWFAHTNRKMMDEMANHGTRIRGYAEKHGLENVEEFLDACLSIQYLIDPHAPAIRRRRAKDTTILEEDDQDVTVVRKISAKSYMDRYINPPDFIEEQRRQIEEDKKKEEQFPAEPERDVLRFLMDHAPIPNWQKDILAMAREEGYYFTPQAQTKIMNEGWASYWHSRIMTTRALRDSEVIDYADRHSGTMGTSPGQLNPYKLGVELFRDIEDRWNKGKFGPEYEQCDDYATRRDWDRKVGLGREKIFEVRRIFNDVTFIDTFLTEDFCREHRLFTYAFNRHSGNYEIESREFKAVKQKLLFSLTNFGQPVILVQDANYINRGELYLRHKHEGVDLKMDEAKETMRNVQRIWRRPVHLETAVEERPKLLSFDGSNHSEKNLK